MLRIANWYESGLGRNDGNPLYVTAFLKRVQFFCEVLEKKNMNERLLNYFPAQPPKDAQAEQLAVKVMDLFGGLEIEHLRPYGDDLHTYGKFDCHIWVDWGEDGLTSILPYTPVFPTDAPLVYWASDTHLGLDYRVSVGKRADIVFVAQQKAVQDFLDAGVTATWLPHCFDPLAYPRYSFASRKYDVCFVGHVNSENRMDFLDSMFKEFPEFFFGQRRFENASIEYAKSKVCLNLAMKDDLNMRVFEVLGSGNFLITDRISSIETLFKDKQHLVLFDSVDDAVEKTREYLTNDATRHMIAEQGYQQALSSHTIAHRVERMLEGVHSHSNQNLIAL